MQTSLVILAAGMGTRFGGPKQFTPVGIFGEPIMHFTIRDAWLCGIEHVVLITREELRAQAEAALSHLPPGVTGEIAIQPMDANDPKGTAAAIVAAAPYLTQPFIVVNGDDLYGREAIEDALECLERDFDLKLEIPTLKGSGHPSLYSDTGLDVREPTFDSRPLQARLGERGQRPGGAEHHPAPEERLGGQRLTGTEESFPTLKGSGHPGEPLGCTIPYPVLSTIWGEGGLSRAWVQSDGEFLKAITELHNVHRTPAGTIEGTTTTEPKETVTLPEDAAVSMNIFGLHPAIIPFMREFIDVSRAEEPRREVGIPHVLNHGVGNNLFRIRTKTTTSRCFGMTFPEDLEMVRAEVRNLYVDHGSPAPLW